MTEGEMIRLIRQVIRAELTPILMGTMQATEDQFRGTVRRFASDGPLEGKRQIKPYGFASRAPKDTDTVVMPIAGDPTNLLLMGEFDSKRPELEEGEAALYGPDGQVILMKAAKEIAIGSKDADEPLVLGNILKAFASALIGEVKGVIGDLKTIPAGLTTGPGSPIAPNPGLVTALTAHETSLTSMEQQYVSTDTSNFVSKKNFTERGED